MNFDLINTTTNNNNNDETLNVDYDLKKLANEYQFASGEKQQSDEAAEEGITLKKTFLSCHLTDNMSGSIDKLLDSFFTKEFTSEELTSNTPMLQNANKSKSINIQNSDDQMKINAFSLSDLANEYLSTMTPSTTNNEPVTFDDAGESLVDLIDTEFGTRFSLNEEGSIDRYFELAPSSTSSMTIDLSKENLLMNKKDRQSILKYPMSAQSPSSVSSTNSLMLSSSMRERDREQQAKKFQLIPSTMHDEEFLKIEKSTIQDIYNVKERSDIGLFFSINNELKHELFDQIFAGEIHEHGRSRRFL
jgi:hypothetical protein